MGSKNNFSDPVTRCCAASNRRVSAVTYVEDDFFKAAQISIELVTETHTLIARHAYRDFGNGSGYPAKLNFGDYFAYALAKSSGEPLLFKGNDFTHTDITSISPA
jgi:ribonuclease VapC